MNKFSTIAIFVILLLCIGNVYSIDHSLGGDLEIKQSVIDKMKKEKFTYSFKEIKNRRNSINPQCSTFKGKVIYVLNAVAKKIEKFKRGTENFIDNCSMKKLGVLLFVGTFIVWYVRRVIKNNIFGKEKVNVYFNESRNYEKKKSYQDLSYPYYNSSSYNNNYHYLSSYNSEMGNESPYQAREIPTKSKLSGSRFFSQRKRKDSNNENTNLFSYAYV